MKNLLALIAIATIFLPFTAKADLAPEPGYHRVTSCAYFDNLSDYPAYDVYQTANNRFGAPAIDARAASDAAADIASNYGCGNNGAPFFAVKKSNQANITHTIDEERGDLWATLSVNTAYLIQATVTGTPRDYSDELVFGDMPDANPTVAFVSVYHIDTLTDDTFAVRLVDEAQYDTDGVLLSETTDGRTTPGATDSAMAAILLVAIAVVGLVAIATVRRRSKKA